MEKEQYVKNVSCDIQIKYCCVEGETKQEVGKTIESAQIKAANLISKTNKKLKLQKAFTLNELDSEIDGLSQH